jgi:hypothetical protein
MTSLDLSLEAVCRLFNDLSPADVQIVGDDWIWPRCLMKSGYGWTGKQYTHRVVVEATQGPIPDGLEVDHVWERGCRSRACFRPDHLEVVTGAENKRRAWAVRKGDACPSGHPRTPENTRNRPEGRTAECAECHRIFNRIRSAALRGPDPRRLRAEEVRRLLGEGMSPTKVAATVGCAKATVHRIKSGEVFSR